LGVFALAMWGLSNDRTRAFDDFWLVVVSVYSLISFVRLTIWAVNNARATN
jgi:hypothetical protein